MENNKKGTIILILKILEKYSDEDHYLKQQEIIDLLDKEFKTYSNRKTVSSSIAVLKRFGYDIKQGEFGGYALVERLFDTSQARFLIDAIFSSKSISAKDAEEIVNQISSTFSVYEKYNYKYLNKSYEISRTSNKQVFLNIDVISDALKKKKFVNFKYQEYDEKCNLTPKYDGRVYHLSPCFLINNFGKYYFIGYDEKHENVAPYRVDFMKDIEIESKDSINVHNIEDFNPYKSIKEYIDEHIYFFGGKSVVAKIKLNGKYAITYVLDWFLNNATIQTINDEIFAYIKCNENALFYWLVQYGEHVTLISPTSLQERLKNYFKNQFEKYKN